MTNFLKRNRFNFIMLALGLLCWGRLLVLKGLWVDDWLWVWHYFGSKSISDYFHPTVTMLRPLDGFFSLLNYKLFDIIPQATTNIYNIERFLLFIINATLLYRIAKYTLHTESLLPEIIAIVYLVSPLVHNLSATEVIRRLYLCFFLISIIFSIKSVNKGGKIKKYNYLAAILFCSLAMLGYESLISIDLLRPLIIFYILTGKLKEKTYAAVKRVFFYWLPFLIIGIAIAFYKGGLIIPRSGPFVHGFEPYNLPAYRYISFLIYCYSCSLYYLFIEHILYYIKTLLSFNYELILIILPSLTALFAFFFVFRHCKIKRENSKYPFSDILLKETRLVTFIGIFLILLGIAPYPLFARYIEFGGGSRNALSASIGVAIFVSSSLLWLHYKGLMKRRQFCILLAAIVFFWAFGCNDAIRAYNNDWQQQRSFWWQFVWRVPELKDKTFLIVDMPREETAYLGIEWCGLFEFGCPINLLYAKSKQKGETYSNNYFGDTLGRVLFEGEQYYIKSWKKDEVLFDGFVFPLKYYPRNLLLASYHNGYLYLNNDIKQENSSGRVNVKPLVANSSESRIIYGHKQPNYPLRWIIGPEPKKVKNALRYEIWQGIFGKDVYKDWRYYFQKIKVLEHVEDYKGIVDLYNEAEALGWNPQLPQPIPISVVKSLYLTGNIHKANFLLWKWSLSFEGDFKKALNMLESIKSENNDPNLHAAIGEEINRIWKGITFLKNN